MESWVREQDVTLGLWGSCGDPVPNAAVGGRIAWIVTGNNGSTGGTMLAFSQPLTPTSRLADRAWRSRRAHLHRTGTG